MKIKKLWTAECNMDEVALVEEVAHKERFWKMTARQQGTQAEPTVYLDRKDMMALHSVIQDELYPPQTDEQKYGTTDPATIAYEKMAEGIRDIAELLKELGIPETKINEITDKIHEVEFINRREP